MTNVNLSQLFNLDELLLESAFNPMQIILSLAVTLLMAIFIYFVYKKTYNGVLYSKNFNLTLMITALTVNAIMIGISGNIILSLGLVGALSIIRFRTAVKDPKDTAFLFWSVTVGVINGVAYYELSIIASIFIAAVLFILSGKTMQDQIYVLILKHRPGAYTEVEKTLEAQLKKYVVRSDSQHETEIEKVIEIKLNGHDTEKILNDIRQSAGVSDCTMLSSNGAFAE